MYESYFGMTCRPFLATPDARVFADVGNTQESLAQLEVCIRSGQGLALLTAPAGFGKTMVCRKLIELLEADFTPVFLGNSNFATRRSLLQSILYELQHPYVQMGEQELRLQLVTAVREAAESREAVLLIVDEAHRLNSRVIEELRTLADLSHEGRSLVRILLSGQLALEERLAEPELDALRQRIRTHAILEPLSRADSAALIVKCLEYAGVDPAAILTEESLELICHASDGSPRCLNQLADHCLLLTFMSERDQVTGETVRDALDDLKQLPLQWNDLPAPAASLESSIPDHCPSPESAVPNAGDADAEEDAGRDAKQVGIAGEPDETNASADPSTPVRIAMDLPALPGIELGHPTLVEIQADSADFYPVVTTKAAREHAAHSLSPHGDAPPTSETSASGQSQPLVDDPLHADGADEDAARAGSHGEVTVMEFGADIDDPAASLPHLSATTELRLGDPMHSQTKACDDASMEATSDGFREEPLIDRYTLLDAGRPLPAAAAQPALLDPETTFLGPLDCRSALERRAMQGGVLRPVTPPAAAADSGTLPIEAAPATALPQSQPDTEAAHQPLSPADAIASDVFDTGLAALHDVFTEQASAPDELIEEIMPALADAVQELSTFTCYCDLQESDHAARLGSPAAAPVSASGESAGLESAGLESAPRAIDSVSSATGPAQDPNQDHGAAFASRQSTGAAPLQPFGGGRTTDALAAELSQEWQQLKDEMSEMPAPEPSDTLRETPPLEDAIGDLVFETSREVERATRPQRSPLDRPPVTRPQFDVVEPEEGEAVLSESRAADSAGAAAGSLPQSGARQSREAYARLFSRLRQRRRESGGHE